jgi:hypothetical protein
VHLHLASDPAIANDPDRAPEHLAVRRAAERRVRSPRGRAERRHGVEEAMGQNEHRHNDVFGDRRLVAELIANCDPLRHRVEIEEVEPSRHRLQKA